MYRLSHIGCFLLLAMNTTIAQWSTDPSNNLIVGFGLTPEIASDGSGGCYITYVQQVGIYDRLWLERLNRYGYKPWGTRRQIIGVFPGQSAAQITEDGSGGVIVSYIDYQLTSPKDPVISRVRVQRIDSSGNFLWGSAGVRVTEWETPQGGGAIVSDGAGGCIVAWADLDTISFQTHLRINRIDEAGNRVWGDTGRYVWNQSESPPMISDMQDGCYMLYGIGRLQRFRPDGSTYWPPQGVLIPTGPWIIRLDHGSIYLFGSRYIGNNGQSIFSIHLQKVDSSGNLLWDTLGVTLDTLNTNLFLNYDFFTQEGYSTIAWPQDTGGVWDLRTQIVRSNGSTGFPQGGVPISRTSSQKWIIGVLPSDSMTSIYVWDDYRTTGGTYAQRLDTSGRRLWDTSDVVVSFSRPSKVVTDGNGGLIAIVGGQNFAVRAQQVNKYGQLGQVITSVENEIGHEFPEQLVLYQNYPNPFNPKTTIKYDLPLDTKVNLRLYDLLGREVKALVERQMPAGVHHVIVDGSNLASGVYLYRIDAGSFTQAKKLFLLK